MLGSPIVTELVQLVVLIDSGTRSCGRVEQFHKTRKRYDSLGLTGGYLRYRGRYCTYLTQFQAESKVNTYITTLP